MNHGPFTKRFPGEPWWPGTIDLTKKTQSCGKFATRPMDPSPLTTWIAASKNGIFNA